MSPPAPATRPLIKGQLTPAYETILTPDAIGLLTDLHGQFNTIRQQRLADRERQQERFDQGDKPNFVKTNGAISDLPWRTSPTPADLQNRRVEITGPVDRRMIINALNSGANGFMADFEDSTSPTWDNLMQGQVNLHDAIRREIDFTNEAGKRYTLNETTAVLHVRPRGWHLPEKHFLIDGEPTSGALFDFGLYVFHNAHELLRRGSGPYLYLPKLENRAEARLWDQVCSFAEARLDLPANSIKVTVLIETITAAFEMEEIIYELSHCIVGLNAGRWDYIFSFIKKLKTHEDALLPDRAQVTMTVPFMRAYAQRLVRVCHRRG
ncbi:MAG: malate synthase A, partial [Bacteroidetes bacterium]|nr:malate synthase A [Fibrella sp.]